MTLLDWIMKRQSTQQVMNMQSSIVYIHKPNRSTVRPKSGYSNFYTNRHGKIGLKIGSIDHGIVPFETTEDKKKWIAFRDQCLVKQSYPPAKY